jgi:DnaJ domain
MIPNSSRISVLQAHKLLGLMPQAFEMPKESIQAAYLTAAKRYHPDSRNNTHATPCARSFRQCHEARQVLLRYYGVAAPSPPPLDGSQAATYAWRSKSYHPLAWLQNSKTRQFAFGVKALVLILAACDGVYYHDRRRRRATGYKDQC